MTLKRWVVSSLLIVILVAPALAGTRDGTDAKSAPDTSAKTTAQPASAASANLTPAAASPNIKALVGILVTKGVLSPSEADSIFSWPNNSLSAGQKG
jgi:hypothetical protein